MEGFFQVRSVRGRTEDRKLRGRHELQRRQILLQILELLVVFRGVIFDSHEGPHEHQAESYRYTTNPDTIRKVRETTSVGEVLSDDAHGGPVVPEVSSRTVVLARDQLFPNQLVNSTGFRHRGPQPSAEHVPPLLTLFYGTNVTPICSWVPAQEVRNGR